MQRTDQLHGLTENEIDRKLRSETFCRGCGDQKDRELVVCWNCFKHRTIGGYQNCLKYYCESGGPEGLLAWLNHIDSAWPRMALDTVHVPANTQRPINWPYVGNCHDFEPSDADSGL